ncbi:hypothetical protein AK830_g10347 [Neonectria ditissima]|uniref:Mid2 domain-containing protein n=1 Tax=Neonectria ditissima TaxID=78410 RepID=A0A0N8H5H8_9HYPO|nr:hypothetical protein AK830_g10347 [Neonectria ditissima]
MPLVFLVSLIHASHIHSFKTLYSPFTIMPRLTFVLLFICSLQSCFAASQCYYPNGAKSNDFPCDPDADESVCCGGGLGSVCLSNKLCQGANGNTVRGSCTDQNWSSLECPMFCLGADTGGTDLVSCSNVTDSDTSYCCDHNPGCCNSGVGRFNVFPSEPDTWAIWNKEVTQYTVVHTLSSTEPTSTTTQAKTTSTSSAKITTSTLSTTTREIPSPTDSAINTPGSSEAPVGLSTGAKAGIGAGAVIGAVITAAIVYLLWKTRKNERAAKENKQLPPACHPPPPMDSAWQRSYYTLKEPQNPQELDGRQYQGYMIRAELPAHN